MRPRAVPERMVTLLVGLLGAVAVRADLTLDLLMPGVTTEATDSYRAFAVTIPTDLDNTFVVRIEPRASQTTVHHMLMYGCDGEASDGADGHHDVLMQPMCRHGRGERILYGWAKDAAPMEYPENVGLAVGGNARLRTLVVQVHYNVIVEQPDNSGLVLHLSKGEGIQHFAGLWTFVAGFEIPARTPRHEVNIECCYRGTQPLHAFAFRVHTHALGRAVWLRRPAMDANSSDVELMRRSPQLPQGFAPLNDMVIIHPGDHLRATCWFDSSDMNETVHVGHTGNDEMCNLYLMFYADLPTAMTCYNDRLSIHTGEVFPPRPLLMQAPALRPGQTARRAGALNIASVSSPQTTLHAKDALPGMGQVGGTAVSPDGATLAVFHRAERVWTGQSYSGELFQHMTNTTPISHETVMLLDRLTGSVRAQWGRDLFSMPHGLTIDSEGHLWLTDCGLHQVFKYTMAGERLLALGEPLVPGEDTAHFCKPTHVAVLADGSFYVADGYCNSRVLRFDAHGGFLSELRSQTLQPFRIPHSVVVDACRPAIYVADRESSLVQIFSPDGTGLGVFDLSTYGRPYAIDMRAGRLIAIVWPKSLTWDRRGGSKRSQSNIPQLLEMDELSRSNGHQMALGTVRVLALPNVASPHTLSVTDTNGEGCAHEGACVYIGETRARESQLHQLPLGSRRG